MKFNSCFNQFHNSESFFLQEFVSHRNKSNNKRLSTTSLNVGLKFIFPTVEFEKRTWTKRGFDIAFKGVVSGFYFPLIDTAYGGKLQGKSIILFPHFSTVWWLKSRFFFEIGIGVANYRISESLKNYPDFPKPIKTVSDSSLIYSYPKVTKNEFYNFYSVAGTVSFGMQLLPKKITKNRLDIKIDALLHLRKKIFSNSTAEPTVSIFYSMPFGLNRKSQIIRTLDNQQYVRLNKKKIPINELPERF